MSGFRRIPRIEDFGFSQDIGIAHSHRTNAETDIPQMLFDSSNVSEFLVLTVACRSMTYLSSVAHPNRIGREERAYCQRWLSTASLSPTHSST